jgi:hypothetical protein
MDFVNKSSKYGRSCCLADRLRARDSFECRCLRVCSVRRHAGVLLARGEDVGWGAEGVPAEVDAGGEVDV